jgi:DNA-directed RNA polymerase specialized sigma24 family protein
MAVATELEHIARVLDGERAAFDALYDTLLPAAWQIAATRSRERGAAEALARAILIQAFRHLTDRSRERSLAQWLESIADEIDARRHAPVPPAAYRHTSGT